MVKKSSGKMKNNLLCKMKMKRKSRSCRYQCKPKHTTPTSRICYLLLPCRPWKNINGGGGRRRRFTLERTIAVTRCAIWYRSH